MFNGFKLEMIDVGPGKLRVRHGGSGPPVLLLHGHPRTHMTWGRVADLLPQFTVVCPDLRGFGQSFQPADAEDSAGSSKRAKADDCIELMRRLGHERFMVAGHDRGGYVAFRMAMDHADAVTRLALIDCIPIVEHLDRISWEFARDWYHWFFFAQREKPERAINADPLGWYGDKIDPDRMDSAAYADLIEAIRDPAVIHGMVEDYRAGLTVDRRHEMRDRDGGRRIRCPLLCLWSTRDDLERLFGDPRVIWQEWATEVSGHGIDSGHHVAEDNPEALAAALAGFFGST